MNRIGLLMILVLGWVGLFREAEATNESQAAVLMLLIEPGARVGGMGGSFVTISEDALATYYNPAGLAGQENRQLTFMHTNWLAALVSDLYYEYFAYSQYVEGWGNIGLSLTYFNMGEQIRTTEHGDEEGTFTSYDLASSIAYGAHISRNLALGITGKIIYSHLADLGAGQEKGAGTGLGFGADVGVLYQPPVEGMKLGAALRNIGPKISYIDARQADPLPLHFVVGASYQVLETEFSKVLAVLDLYKPLVKAEGTSLESMVSAWADEDAQNELEQIDLHAGIEYTYSSFLSLRAGYSYDKDGAIKTPTFGFSLKYDWIQMDYAYLSAQNTPLQDNSRFSVTMSF
ncbi:MAG: PorV/PorQ family protein [Candidatus Latescibacterota bacterium]